MAKFYTFFLLCFLLSSGYLRAQPDSVLFGLTRSSSPAEIHLGKIDLTTGQVTSISSAPVSNAINLNAISTIDPNNNIFYFQDMGGLKGLDLQTGSIVSAAKIKTSATEYFELMQFNAADSTLYGIFRNRSPFRVQLAKIQPQTGEITPVSDSLGMGYNQNSIATIDQRNNIYYFLTGNRLFGVDIHSGTLVKNIPFTIPVSGTINFMRYNCQDSTIYCLIGGNDPAGTFLGKLDTETGEFIKISTVSLSPVLSAAATGTIDPYNKIFYFQNGTQLLGADLVSGEIVSGVPVLSPFEHGVYFEFMNFYAGPCTGNDAATPVRSKMIPLRQLSIYPNPSAQQVNIRMDFPLQEDMKLLVYDLQGKKVYGQEGLHSNIVSFHKGQLSDGVYIVQLLDGNNQLVAAGKVVFDQ